MDHSTPDLAVEVVRDRASLYESPERSELPVKLGGLSGLPLLRRAKRRVAAFLAR
jgi:hypothetical protein